MGKNYSVVRLTALHGLDISTSLSCTWSEFLELSYDDQRRTLFDARILYSDSFSRSMERLGQVAAEIVWDFEPLQKNWAKENGVSYDHDNWTFDILIAQITALKPDIVYLQGTELAIPGRFPQLGRTTTFPSVLKDKFGSIRLIGMYSGFPSKVDRLNGVDILFSASPSIDSHYHAMGVSSVLCYHAFDDSIVTQMKSNSLSHDFTFVGSARAPEQRYWLLRDLLDRIPIELWIDEPDINESSRRPVFNKNELRKRLRKAFVNMARTSLSGISNKKLEFLATSERIPTLLRNVLNDITINTRATGRSAQTGAAIGKPLREMYPRKCHKPVMGLSYFNIMSKSKITLNKHTDKNMGIVGNLRLFEATGVGTCLLTDTGQNMIELYEPDTEIVTYGSAEEAIEKVNYLLENESERASIASAGQKKTLSSHTIFHRCQLIDEVFQSKL